MPETKGFKDGNTIYTYVDETARNLANPPEGNPGDVLTRTETGTEWAAPQGGGSGGDTLIVTLTAELAGANPRSIPATADKTLAEVIAAYTAGKDIIFDVNIATEEAGQPVTIKTRMVQQFILQIEAAAVITASASINPAAGNIGCIAGTVAVNWVSYDGDETLSVSITEIPSEDDTAWSGGADNVLVFKTYGNVGLETTIYGTDPDTASSIAPPPPAQFSFQANQPIRFARMIVENTQNSHFYPAPEYVMFNNAYVNSGQFSGTAVFAVPTKTDTKTAENVVTVNFTASVPVGTSPNATLKGDYTITVYSRNVQNIGS